MSNLLLLFRRVSFGECRQGLKVGARARAHSISSNSASAASREFDYVIIGGGSSGSVLANRLSENAANRVLLIEAGEDDNYFPIHVPVGYLHCIANPRTDWCFKTTAQKGLANRELPYPRGKVLGGSSSINGMIYMRGQKEDYNNWAELTDNEDWMWDNLLPLWMSHENYHGFDKNNDSSQFNNNSDYLDGEETLRRYHGEGGPWSVSTQRTHSAAMEIFREAAIESGINATGDFNQGNNEGIGFFDVNQKHGWRLTAYQAFVHPLTRNQPGYRSNLTVLPKTLVKKLLFNDTKQGQKPRCIGVVTSSFSDNVASSKGVNGNELFFNSAKEVILASGSIGSVQILERSGIGNAEKLQKITKNHKVISDLPGVGENLQDHLQIRPVFGVSNVPGGTLNSVLQSWKGKFNIGYDFMVNQQGPLTVAPSCLGAFVPSSSQYKRPNLEFHIQNLSLGQFGSSNNSVNDGSVFSQVASALNKIVHSPLDKYDAITAAVVNVRPTSRGSVHITGTDLGDIPEINPRYLSTHEDQCVAIDSLKLMRKIVTSTKAFQPYKPVELRPSADIQSDRHLLEAASNLGTTIFHPVGTTKMGRENDPLAVVDSKLRVIGVDGLRVADASIMPNITSGNTAAPTMAIAERAARYILEE